MAAKLGQKKKGQTPKKAVKPVNDVETDSNVVLTKTPEVNVKREKAKGADKSGGFFAFFHKFDPIAMCCFIAVILAGLVVIGAYVNTTYINPDDEDPVAIKGDTVKVEYIGSYGAYYDETGAVIFDTNVKSVNDNSDLAKSPSYTNKTSFSLLEFDIGGTKVLEMFGNAVIGKQVGDVVKVAIDPANGYGTLVSDKKVFTVSQTLNVCGTMSLADFNEYASTSFKTSDFDNYKIVQMPNGLSAKVERSGASAVTYQYVDLVVDADNKISTLADSDVKIAVTGINTTDNTFTISYDAGTASMYKAVIQDGSGEQIVYVDNFSGSLLYKPGAADNDDMQEQKGEVLYFWIKVVEINGYDGN